MINDHEYWNGKFEESSDMAQRSAQTEYFVKLALDNLPQWCVESISKSCATICDMGCAGGEGTVLLQNTFPGSKVTGIDFSEIAVQEATTKNKQVRYQTGDIRSFQEHYDVVFSSNVLEHFYDAQELLKQMLNNADQYLILLLPFREYYRISEHATTFDFRSFPLREGEHTLCYFKIIPMCSDEDKRFWIGEQILIVYKHERVALPYGVTLENIYNGYMEERTKIIVDYDQKLAVQQDALINKERELVSQTDILVSRENELSEKRQQLEVKQEELLSQYRELANKSEELIQKDQKLLDKEEKLADMREELASVKETLNDAKGALGSKEQTLCDVSRSLASTREELAGTKEELKDCRKKLLDSNNKIDEIYLAHEQTKRTLELYSSQLNVNEDSIQQIRTALAITQQSRSYKWSLAMRRLLNQFFRGNRAERRDFIRWVWSKIRHRDNGSKWLREFDFLENAKSALWQIHMPTETVHSGYPCPYRHVTDDPCAKTGRQIFIFGSVPYYDVGGGQRSAQMAKAYNEMGYRVYYIFGFDSSESKREEMHIPAIKHVHIDQYSVEEMASVIRDDAVLIFEIPYAKFEPYLDYARKRGIETIYEHIDNWDSSLGCMFYDEQVFKTFVKHSGAIAVTARLLGEKIKDIWSRDYLYLANAVNSTLFEPSKTYQKPDDLVQGKKTLLYFGSLWGEWFDWDKILYVANHCDCEINLIGDYQPILEKTKTMPKNIHFLGLKKQTDLPAYLHYSDIALLPFKNCEIGKYVSPLKIFEYIAMNKPVLATPLDDIAGYPNVIATDSKKEWAAAVEMDWELQETSTFISQNNWFARCNELLKYSAQEKNWIPSISIVVLNHNNMKVIFRCISSLLDFNEKYHCEIVVVDNDSTDGSFEKLGEKYGNRIVLVKNKKNGCSSGRNLGVKYASGEMIFFLDSDQWVVSESYLDSALDIMRRDDSIGAVGWNAGWFNPGRYDGPIVDYLPNRGMDTPSKLYRTDIAYLATSGMLMRTDLFKEINGFDEFYDPTCFEDTDISLKIRNAGYELAYCPYMAIMHLPHQTTNSGSKRHMQLMERNGTYFIDKWKKIDGSLLEYHL